MDLGIDYTYDSHVHFFGTGIPAVDWDLKTQKNVPKHLKENTFIRGFGWNDESYFKEEVKNLKDTTFFLSKVDGHTAFISNNLVKNLNIDPSDFEKYDDIGFIVKEHEKDFIERMLPKRSDHDLKEMALYAQDLFLKNGFKKVRHLTCTKEHFKILTKLEEDNLLQIKIECFFSEFMGQTFEEAIEAFAEAKETSLLKPKGLKVFYDGSFGSQTAYSLLFPNVETRMSLKQLKNRVEVAFELECDIAVHTIGEKAVEEAVAAFKDVLKDFKTSKTKLHLEHCPAFSNKVFEHLKNLPVILHFQPSHYDGDKKYLDKLKKKDLLIYPFTKLKENNIEFHFGSDSPVENIAPYTKDEITKLL